MVHSGHFQTVGINFGFLPKEDNQTSWQDISHPCYKAQNLLKSQKDSFLKEELLHKVPQFPQNISQNETKHKTPNFATEQ